MRRFALLGLLFAAAAAAQNIEACCSVTVKVRTAEGLPIPGAVIVVESGAMKYNAQSDVVVALRTPGQYRATASADGYASQTEQFNVARDENARIELVLARRDTVTVEDRASAIEAATAGSTATRNQIRSLPERVSDVRNALPLIPGVVRTPEGKLQIAASPEYRSTFLVNSVDVTDPATGLFGATVPIDVIETLQVYKSPFLAEYGRFSAAVVEVTTRRGGDKWHYELNDPTPEFRIRSGHIVGVRGFTPRFAATGPLLRNKLYFAGAGSFELRKRPVYPLPFPFNEEKSQRVNAYTQFDYMRSARHLISVSLHGVPQRTDFTNLNFYTPQTAAPAWRAHEYRGTVASHVDTEVGLFDSSFSVSELRSRTWAQGEQALRLTPVTTFGNYFLRQDRRSQRAQFVQTWSARPKVRFGKHSFKAGAALGHTTFNGGASAHDVYIESLSGQELSAIAFRNQRPFRLSDWDLGLFAQDGWEPFPSIRLDAGLRIDRQRLAGVTTVAPRIGLAWMPEGRTVVRGGYGWFYDRVPLNVFAFPQYPYRFDLPNLLKPENGFAPKSQTISAGVDYRLTPAVLLHTGYIHTNSSGLLVVRPERNATVLSGSGAGRTRELELTTKITWYPEQHWIISYVHTRGRGYMNSFDRFLGDFPEPLLRDDVIARLPGVVPHRFLSWGVFPLPYGLQFAPVVEWRNGFPYAILNEYQQYAGAPNAQFLPTFFSLDTRVSKDVALRGHKVRFSFSVFNVTDHGNYDAIRLNTADPQLGEALGKRPRRFRLDFDWLF